MIKSFTIATEGHNDFVNITDQVITMVSKSGVEEGIVLIFVPSSTVALTTMEYEEGVIKDLTKVFEEIAPEDFDYEHHKRWGDRNGAAHIKSALIGTDLTIPIKKGKLLLGAWQQIVLIDFDEKPRSRDIFVKTVKEA